MTILFRQFSPSKWMLSSDKSLSEKKKKTRQNRNSLLLITDQTHSDVCLQMYMMKISLTKAV